MKMTPEDARQEAIEMRGWFKRLPHPLGIEDHIALLNQTITRLSGTVLDILDTLAADGDASPPDPTT